MQYKDKPSTLTYINAYGLTHEITGFHTIGSGGRYAKVLLRVQDLYDNNMTMKEVAEIGYFIIKYIEYFELDFSVGIDHLGLKFGIFLTFMSKTRDKRWSEMVIL